jgi:hypothetical protein
VFIGGGGRLYFVRMLADLLFDLDNSFYFNYFSFDDYGGGFSFGI